MSLDLGLPDEAKRLGQALGLLDEDGNIRPEWFAHPVGELRNVLRSETQREALLDLLALVAPVDGSGTPRRHRLLPAGHPGQLHLVVEPLGSGVRLGLGAALTVEAPAAIRLQATVPLIDAADAGLTVVAATAGAPLRLSIEADLPALPAPLRLRTIGAHADLVLNGPVKVVPRLDLLGFALGTAAPRDLRFDPTNLGPETVDLVLGLVRDALNALGGAQLAHLAGVLGLDPGMPRFPLEQLGDAPGALRGWIESLRAQDRFGDWLRAVAQLVGFAPGAVSGNGTAALPFRLQLVGDANLALSLAVVLEAGRLRPALSLRAGPAAGAHLLAEATLLDLPLSGDAPVVPLPAAEVVVRAGGPPSVPAITVGEIRAGVRLADGAPAPVLELRNVRFQGATHPVLDLTRLETAADLASNVVEQALRDALGSNAMATRLLVAVGLADPASAPGWPHQLDILRFVGDPLGELRRFWRGVADDAGHAMRTLLAEMLGRPGTGAGTGTPADPWRVAIATTGPLSLQVAAWRPEGDADTVLVALRVAVASAPFTLAAAATLVSLHLPAAGAPGVSLPLSIDARLDVAPLLPAVPVGGTGLEAASFAARVAWTPGQAPAWNATLSGLRLTVAGEALPAVNLSFPSSVDFSNPAAAAAALGLGAAQLEAFARGLVARAATKWGGVPGAALAALLGLQRVFDLPADLPVLTAPAGRSLLTDPGAALRPWLASLARTVDAAGRPALESVITLLQATLQGALPAMPHHPLPALPLAGRGTPAEPWAVAVGPASLLLWLGPDGPPWAAARLAGADASPLAFAGAAVSAAASWPALAARVEHNHRDRLAAGLEALTAFLAASDGVVPLLSASPPAPDFTAGGPFAASHDRLPAHPDAIAAVLAQVAAWGPDALVVLLGTAATDWTALLAAPARPGTTAPGAHFDFRLADTPPDRVDLDVVTDVVDWYRATLVGTDAASLEAQVRRILNRIAALQPGRPVVLVAHSLAGLGARRAAAGVRGVVTLGTPHVGARPPFDDVSVAAAMSLYRLVRAQVPAGALRDALDFADRLGELLPAEVPTEPSLATGGVPVLALAGRLDGEPVAAFAAALAALAPGAPAGAALPTAPDRVGLGFELTVAGGFGDAVRAEAFLRLDLAEIGLDGVLVPTRRLSARLELDRPGGWLVGQPGRPGPRLRSATISLDLSGGDTALDVRLNDAALDGPPLPRTLADAVTPALLGEAIRAIAPDAAAPLLDALAALGLVTTGPDAVRSLALDAFEALRHEGLAWLAPRLGDALNGVASFAGLRAATHLDLGPVRASVDLPGRALVLSTLPDGLTLFEPLRLDASVRIALPDVTPSVTATLSLGEFGVRWASSQLALTAPKWMDDLVLFPAPADLPAQLGSRLGRLVFSAGAAEALSGLLPAGMRLPPLDAFFGGRPRSGPPAADAPPLPAEPIAELLQLFDRLLGHAPGDGLALPANIEITAIEDAGATVIRARTTAPFGGVLDLRLGLRLSAGGRIDPEVRVGLALPLDGAWSPLGVEFELRAAGPALALILPGPTRVELFPTFGGLTALLSGGAALLPAALNALLDALPNPPSAVETAALGVAQAFGLYDPVNRFATHAPQFQDLLDGGLDFADPATRTQVVNAIAALFGPGLIPLTVVPSGASLTWSTPVFGHPLTVAFDWGQPVPTLSLDATFDFGGAVRVTADFEVGPGGVAASAGVGLPQPLGLPLHPRLRAAVGATGISLQLRPLAPDGVGDGPLRVDLLPTPGVTADADLPQKLALDVLLPLAAELLDRAIGTTALWSAPGAPTLGELVQATGLFDASWRLVDPLPSVPDVVIGLIEELGVSIPLGPLTLILGDVGADQFGVALSGTLDIPLGGDLELRLIFGRTAAGSPGAARVAVILFQGGAFAPTLDAHGLGIGLGGATGPLVRTDIVRLGGVDAFTFFSVDFHPTFSADFAGAGLLLDDVSLPLGQLGGGGGNPVVGSLLGGGQPSGDQAPAQPGVDVVASYYRGTFDLSFEGEQALWIGVRAAFGPLYIEQVGLRSFPGTSPTTAIDLLVDGGVTISGLSVQVDDLSLRLPLATLADPSTWSVDLQGLAIGFSAPGLQIAGGLRKSETPEGLEYSGMLLVKVQSFGLVALGSWGTFHDEQGDFDTFFLFAGLFAVIGLPPLLEIRGLGLGFGYNRRLLIPEDIEAIPDFFLVAALDDPGRLTASPLDVLREMKEQVPARRGSFWFAVGLHGTTFSLVHLTAVVYVALDRGVEVGLLGVARMALPSDDSALVSIELAIKARFSSEEGLLSVQGQLTDNSWLLSRDCQLTGGFAFFSWFKKGQFVLTIGGYHPNFQRPPEFPEVPRVGYRWQLFDALVIKGESYFALTNSCVMAGVRFEAVYDVGWLKAWFIAWADFLLSWDPFHYDISIGVSLGARFTIEIDLWVGTIRISFSVSIGGSLHVLGPPLHGTVTADLGPISITVPFGPDPDDEPDPLDWAEFAGKYLLGGEAEARAVSAQAGGGLLPVEPPGSRPAPGTRDQPWRFAAEWDLRTETRMPATSVEAFGMPLSIPSYVLGIAPMYAPTVAARHVARLFRREPGGGETPLRLGPELDPDRIQIAEREGQFPEAVWRYAAHEPPAAASRNVAGLAGLDVHGVAESINPVGPIDMTKLKDPGPRRPLPFARHRGQDIGAVRTDGLRARELVAEVRPSLAVAEAITGAEWDDVRVALGVPGGGVSGKSVPALRGRASPPVVATLSEGLTMDPVTSAPRVEVARPAPVVALALEAPRLLMAARLPAAPTTAALPALATTVSNAPEAPRVRPPGLPAGATARLMRVPAPGAARPTKAATGLRVDRHAALGVALSPKRLRFRDEQTERLLGNGLLLAPNVAQVWSLPVPDRRDEQAEALADRRHLDERAEAHAGRRRVDERAEAHVGRRALDERAEAHAGRRVDERAEALAGRRHLDERAEAHVGRRALDDALRERVEREGIDGAAPSDHVLRVDGGGALRVVAMTNAGDVLLDVETWMPRGGEVPLPAGTAHLALVALGRPSAVPGAAAVAEIHRANVPRVAAGFGLLSLFSGAVGWQAESVLLPVARGLYLARGARVAVRDERAVALQGVPASALLARTGTVETWLPGRIRTLAVRLDVAAGCDLAPPTVAVRGAFLGEPLRVEGPSGPTWLFPVGKGGAEGMLVTVQSGKALRVVGVAGLQGRADLHARRIANAVERPLVPDGPFTPDHPVRVRLGAFER